MMRKSGEFENAEIPRNDGFWERFSLADEEKVRSRTRTCKMCEYLTEWNICEGCSCWMPLKVKFEGSLCPQNKWSEVPNPLAGITTDGLRINNYDPDNP